MNYTKSLLYVANCNSSVKKYFKFERFFLPIPIKLRHKGMKTVFHLLYNQFCLKLCAIIAIFPVRFRSKRIDDVCDDCCSDERFGFHF